MQFPPLHKYTPGDDGVYAKDLNSIEERLARLEKLSVQAPLTMSDGIGGPCIGLDKKIIEWGFFTLVENMPPHGAGKATATLFDPDSEDDYDYASLSTLSGILVTREENGMVRGRRDTYTTVVYDSFGIPYWATDKLICFRYPYSHDGRWFILPNFQGEQWLGTLEIDDAHPTIATDPAGTPDYDNNKQYAKYRTKFSSCTDLFLEADDLTDGGSEGDGFWIKCSRRGIYHVVATLTAVRTSTPNVGANFEAKYSSASFLNVYLQRKCSNTWITMDWGVIEAAPFTSRSGGITLQGKTQTCYDNDGFRLVVQVSNNTASTGDWRIETGNMHIQRFQHQHMTQLGRLWALQPDGDPDSNILDEEGGYIEENEDIVTGDYDANWVSADGPTPKRHNSGYPPTPAAPGHLP